MHSQLNNILGKLGILLILGFFIFKVFPNRLSRSPYIRTFCTSPHPKKKTSNIHTVSESFGDRRKKKTGEAALL